jgi:hypothetical protein
MQDPELKEQEIQVQEFKTPSTGEYFTHLNIKDKTVVDLASAIYQDQELLQRAITACQGDSRGQSMVAYVRENFGALLPKFPAIQEVYLNQVRLKNAKLKKARRRK